MRSLRRERRINEQRVEGRKRKKTPAHCAGSPPLRRRGYSVRVVSASQQGTCNAIHINCTWQFPVGEDVVGIELATYIAFATSFVNLKTSLWCKLSPLLPCERSHVSLAHFHRCWSPGRECQLCITHAVLGSVLECDLFDDGSSCLRQTSRVNIPNGCTLFISNSLVQNQGNSLQWLHFMGRDKYILKRGWHVLQWTSPYL